MRSFPGSARSRCSARCSAAPIISSRKPIWSSSLRPVWWRRRRRGSSWRRRLDSRLPSNDVDFFLNGQPEVKKRYHDFVASGGGATGPYGHMIRPEVGAPAIEVTGPVLQSRN